MEPTITCPVCGESNPADMVICQNCQWPLRPSAPPPTHGDSGKPGAGGEGEVKSAEPVLPDWLRDAAADFNKALEKSEAGRRRLPRGLLSGLAAQSPESAESVPDWVLRIGGTSGGGIATDDAATRLRTDEGVDETAPPQEAGEPSLVAGTTPTSVDPRVETAPEQGTAPIADLSSMQAPGGAPEDDIYEWLRRLDATASQNAQSQDEDVSEPDSGVPDWATGAGPDAEANPGLRKPQTASGSQAPLSAPVEQLHEVPDAESTSPALGEPATAGSQTQSALTGAVSVQPSAPEGVPGLDVDAVLSSMRTPDWLGQEDTPGAMSSSQVPPAADDGEAISPAELPSWVEALRPIESAVQEAVVGPPADQPVEHGPLLGLKGVLPGIPGAGRPTRAPTVHGLRLEVTDQQRLRAAQLEGIIARETQPIPLQAMPMLSPQRVLRWAIAAVFLLLVSWSLLSGSQVFPLPSGVPHETLSAIRAVEAIPADARVLVVFDYEPATVGEMEASGASLLDHLLLLRHPVLALVSTSPTGSVLGERFFSGPIAERGYEPGAGFVNLGYLPGGLAGVRAFAKDPTATIPLDAASRPAWGTPALSKIHRLSDFAAIVVLTDALESGRVWIEQTTEERGQAPLIVVSSAQAGPLLLPYAASGQIAGLVAGLNGAVGTEMANSGLPGFVRRYWDSYSLGLYAAALLIVLGSAWRFMDDLRERETQLGG